MIKNILNLFKNRNKVSYTCLVCSLFVCVKGFSQDAIGIVTDRISKEALVSASVTQKGTSNGIRTDFNGKFSFKTDPNASDSLVISYIGYRTKTVKFSAGISVNILLDESSITGKEIVIISERLSEKQKESPLTIESLDLTAIKETPAANFYEGLGQLKGVDLLSASIGFKVINTRGFNSTSPVRSLQIIDAVDNQAPGLNFSLGNFLGASELDVQKVDIIVGASSALYGPNAFNGVISMNTKNPFVHQGLSVMSKIGERGLSESAIRWAQAFKNKNGQDFLAYKFNIFYLRADDWRATNYNPTDVSLSDAKNPGGFDAVNIYGDEYNNDNDDSALPRALPGLNIRYRTGYKEEDIVDYDTRNLKLGTAVHYKVNQTKNTELIYALNFGTGTTVYQGDNRYSLKDITFLQNRLELRNDKFFIRAFATNENAGKSYDAVFTSLLLQQKAKTTTEWSGYYRNYWSQNANGFFQNILETDPNAPKRSDFPATPEGFLEFQSKIYPFLLSNYNEDLVKFHDRARFVADSTNRPNIGEYAFLEPGTFSFDTAFKSIISKSAFGEGGSRFLDKSALYNIQAERKFTPRFAEITLGGNYRIYTPQSQGTIFSDTLVRTITPRDSLSADTTFKRNTITNQEFGIYFGVEKRFMNDKLKINLTGRLDKNQNFDYLFSPAASAVYTFNPQNIARISLSSAIRNPTLADQYLYYNVGTAILLGNLNGIDSLVTVESLIDLLNTQNPDTLRYFNVEKIRPEQVKSIELGYRTSLFNRLFIDGSYYFSRYQYFIGYKIGVDVDYTTDFGLNISDLQAYRVAANANDVVTTQGFSIGLNYFFKNFYSINGNYSFNKLNLKDDQDPIIPAFNTPEHKFNIGISGRDIFQKIGPVTFRNIGFSINYKWVEGYVFEGSPQFTGFVPNYDLVDAQISKTIPTIKTTFKLGCANLLNNMHYEVYGGPLIGRLAYFSVLVDLAKK